MQPGFKILFKIENAYLFNRMQVGLDVFKNNFRDCYTGNSFGITEFFMIGKRKRIRLLLFLTQVELKPTKK